ncbi:MAG: hypothetical protein ACE5EH_02055 [Gammaproteobacteria bacterium]
MAIKSFHLMKAQGGMSHGGSHNFMYKVERDGRGLHDVAVNSMVVHPNGQAETRMLSQMDDWYMAGYELGHAGKHRLMVLFRTGDGKKYKGGLNYYI